MSFRKSIISNASKEVCLSKSASRDGSFNNSSMWSLNIPEPTHSKHLFHTSLLHSTWLSYQLVFTHFAPLWSGWTETFHIICWMTSFHSEWYCRHVSAQLWIAVVSKYHIWKSIWSVGQAQSLHRSQRAMLVLWGLCMNGTVQKWWTLLYQKTQDIQTASYNWDLHRKRPLGLCKDGVSFILIWQR